MGGMSWGGGGMLCCNFHYTHHLKQQRTCHCTKKDLETYIEECTRVLTKIVVCPISLAASNNLYFNGFNGLQNIQYVQTMFILNILEKQCSVFCVM